MATTKKVQYQRTGNECELAEDNVTKQAGAGVAVYISIVNFLIPC